MKNSLILIADNQAGNLETLLREKHYKTAVLTRGEELLDSMAHMQPDLVLLNAYLPEMDGFETCRRIKEQKHWHHIPVILLIDDNDTDDVIKGLKLGASDCIARPFRSGELLLRINARIAVKKSEDQLRRKNRELKEQNATKDIFFSILSHDLRSPFQGLIGLTELLHDDIDKMKKSDIQEFTKMIHDSAGNLLNLVENLLEWSFLDRNKKSFDPEDVNLKKLIDKNIQRFTSASGKKKISLINQVKDPVDVRIDPNMIDTVIRNLLSNAIKYTREGGNVRVDVEKRSSETCLRITDNGIGMNKKVLDHLFLIEKMKSMPGTNNEKGTGLGLLICKELVEKNGGKIEIQSAPDEGTAVTIRLPEQSVPHHEKASVN